MLVCHCKVVYERQIRAVIDAGARDEFDIAAACGAGSECGGCVPTISALLGECAGCPLAGSSPFEATFDMDGPPVTQLG